jgi:hypothetical protein
MTAKSKAEKRKNYIRIGALAVAGVMIITIVLSFIIR